MIIKYLCTINGLIVLPQCGHRWGEGGDLTIAVFKSPTLWDILAVQIPTYHVGQRTKNIERASVICNFMNN